MDRIASQRPLRWSHQARSPLGRDQIAWPTRGTQQQRPSACAEPQGHPGPSRNPILRNVK